MTISVRLPIIAVLLLSQFPSVGFAEDDPDAVLEEVIVTGTRVKSSWQNAPAMVTVIEGDDIENAPPQTVDAVLQRTPSVSSSREHLAECGPGRDVTLRGVHDQKRTLILVDGIPINDGVTGDVNWSMVPKEAVERIEIVRGPMSALYGSGAMGGVINIITRKPKEANETTVKAEYGSLNTSSGLVLQGGRFEKGSYLIGGSIFQTDGYVQVKEPQAYHVKNRRTDLSLLGQVNYRLDSGALLTGRANFVNEDYSRGIRTDLQNNQTSAFSLTYERQVSDVLGLSASLYAQTLDRKVSLGARPDYSLRDHIEIDDSNKYGQLFQADFKVFGFNHFTVGLDSSLSTMKKRNEYDLVVRESHGNGEQMLASLFAEDRMDWAFGNHRLSVIPGVRLDLSRSGEGRSYDDNPSLEEPLDESYPDRSWTAINPKLALVYRYSDSTTVRASVGRSFAAPTLFQLYTVFNRGPFMLYGNPLLEPESAWSGEIGVDQWLTRRFVVRAAGYYTLGTDFIGYRSIGQNQQQLDNINQMQIAGVDAELSYDISSMFAVYGGYTFNHSTVLEDKEVSDNEGNVLPFEPKHRASLGVRFKWRDWIRLDVSGKYVSDRYTDLENTDASKIDGHFTMDAGLSGATPWKLSWAVSVENLLDERYDIYSVPSEQSEAPGLLVNGSLTLAF